MKAHFEMMAEYNAWANQLLYDSAMLLSPEAYRRDMGAYFNSLHGTLNHLYVADTIWMSRFRGLPNPPWALDHIAHDEPADLRKRREALDRDIIGFTGGMTDRLLEGSFSYITVKTSIQSEQKLSTALAHFFNHQTHHRSQVTSALHTMGMDYGATDIPWRPGAGYFGG